MPNEPDGGLENDNQGPEWPDEDAMNPQSTGHKDSYLPTPGPEPKGDGNYVCPACNAGPFEGPRALAKHEGRMHRVHQQSLGPGPIDVLNEPYPPPQSPQPPGGFSHYDEQLPAGVPSKPLDFSPHSEFAERVYETLTDLGFNDQKWNYKKNVIRKLLSTVQGYNNPQSLKQLLYTMGVRVDLLDIIAIQALGTDGISLPGPGTPMPMPMPGGMGQPFGYQPSPYGYPYYQPQPQYQPPQPRESELDKFLAMFGKLKELGLIPGMQQQGAPAWADPNAYFGSLMTAFKSGKETTPPPDQTNTMVSNLLNQAWEQNNNIIGALLKNAPNNDRSEVIHELRDMGLLQKPQSVDELLDQTRKFKELGLVGTQENIEALKVHSDLNLQLKKMELEHAKMLHELKKEDMLKVEQKEQFESLKDLAGRALENIGKPLSQAVGEGMRAQLRGPQASMASTVSPLQDIEMKRAQIKDMRAKLDEAEQGLNTVAAAAAPKSQDGVTK